jgi:APA family basic amino acid/polyamine antiporter
MARSWKSSRRAPQSAPVSGDVVSDSGLPAASGLARELGRWQLLAVAVGAVVGASIYLRPALVAQQLHEPGPIVAAWVLAGGLSLTGALCYARLASLWPQAGGEYVYLGKTIGEPAAFLFGWMRLTVGVAVAAAQASAVIVFASDLTPLGGSWSHRSAHVFGLPLSLTIGPRQLMAVVVIASLAFLNCLGVGKAGRFQSAITFLKVASLMCLLAVLFTFGRQSSAAPVSASADPPGALGWGAALLGALTAFNGWTLAAMLGGETRAPERSVPWALTWGMTIATACYLAANLAFLSVLPVSVIVSGNSALHPNAPSVASLAVTAAVGHQASGILSAVLALSVLGALHVQIMAIPRVFFAMSEDRLLPAIFSRLSSTTHTPTGAIVGYATIASLLAVLGNFDQLSNMAGFGYLIFYALNGFGLLSMLVRQGPGVESSFRHGVQISLATTFVCGTSWLLVTIVARGSGEIVSAVTLMAVGIPVYSLARWLRGRKRTAPPRPSVSGEEAD